jgi:hypothetical protein
MNWFSWLVFGFIVLMISLITFREVRGQEYPIYSPTFPSGVTTDGTTTSTYTTGESITNFGGVYFLGERKSCAKIGNGFICN